MEGRKDYKEGEVGIKSSRQKAQEARVIKRGKWVGAVACQKKARTEVSTKNRWTLRYKSAAVI